MYRLVGRPRHYRWGSTTAIHDLFGTEADGRPLAELWLGAHPTAPAGLAPDGVLSTPGTAPRTTTQPDLAALIADSPESALGADVRARFGPQLPYLLKVIAPAKPLSLQVHPSIERARAGHAAENAAGIPTGDPTRCFPDTNHKPELLYALTKFEAMSGFRAPRRAAELVAGLDTTLARRLTAALRADPTAGGVRTAFSELLSPATAPTPAELTELAQACADRLAAGSPSPRADRTVARLAEAYPGDPGVAASLLLNPVTLHPGEAMFVPAGCVHAYLSGVAVEVMASSDNVLRAGLTDKHIDIPQLLDCVDYVAAPPMRVAPERFHDATNVFYAPVDDFELSVTHLAGDHAAHPLPGRGPRVIVCLEGTTELRSRRHTVQLTAGTSVFVPADDGALTVTGVGTLVQADVP